MTSERPMPLPVIGLTVQYDNIPPPALGLHPAAQTVVTVVSRVDLMTCVWVACQGKEHHVCQAIRKKWAKNISKNETETTGGLTVNCKNVRSSEGSGVFTGHAKSRPWTCRCPVDVQAHRVCNCDDVRTCQTPPCQSRLQTEPAHQIKHRPWSTLDKH